MVSIRPIQNCEVCGRKLYVRPEWHGDEIHCPQCGATLIADVGADFPMNKLERHSLRRVDMNFSSDKSATTFGRSSFNRA